VTIKMHGCGAVVVCTALSVAGLHAPLHAGSPWPSPAGGTGGGHHLLARAVFEANRSLTAIAAAADDKKLSGTWAKKDGELKIEFADNNVVKFAPHGDPATVSIVGDYTFEKGVVKVKVTGYEGKEEIKKKLGEMLPVGLEFSFKWAAKDDTAKLDELKGDKFPDQFKTHIEGDFEKE
jgi:hypothetical protein